MSIKDQTFAPKAIVSSGTGTFDVTGYVAVGSPETYSYYINSDSSNVMTRTGVLWINRGVSSLTFSADTVLEVM